MRTNSSQLVATLFLCAGLASCQAEEESSRQSPPTIIELNPSSSEPADFKLQDQSCLAADNTLPLEKSEIFRWNGLEVEPFTAQMNGFFSGSNGITSDAILKTTYLDTWIRQCDPNKPESSRCLDGAGRNIRWTFSPQESPGVLKVCDPSGSYDRRSYETMGLASAHYTQKAHSTYKDASGDKSLEKIQLSVSPLFIDEYVFPVKDGIERRQREYITHNMAYFPRNSDISYGTIAVFPERKTYESIFPGYFWESSFALGHEFGHHIDLSKNRSYYEAIGLDWNTLTHRFDDRKIGDGAETITGGGTIRSKVNDAVQEAFADLIAFYTDGGTSKSVTGIECLGPNRTIEDSDFVNGDEKSLTEERFGIFLGKSEDTGSQCDPRYEDHHIIGAIIAHTANKVFTELTDSVPQLSDDESAIEKRYLLTLQWLDAFKVASAKVNEIDRDEKRLTPISEAFRLVSDQWFTSFGLSNPQSEEVKNSLCTLIESLLPATPDNPFATSGEECL